MTATGVIGLFLPIFLYDLFGENFLLVMLYYGLGSLLYVVALPFGAIFLNDFGLRNALRVSVFLEALFYGVFYLVRQDTLIYFIPFSLLVLTLFRISYWLPYHVDFAKFTKGLNRGRQFSMIEATRNIAMGLMPLLSGYIIIRFGFSLVFVLAIVLTLLSELFYIRIPKANETFSWSVHDTWKAFFAPHNRKVVFAFAADGMERAIGIVIWPIFIFQLLEGNYFHVGAVSSIIVIITVILQLALGRLIDVKKSEHLVLRWGSTFYALGWIVKIFIITAFHIFVAGVYHNLMKIFMRTSFDVLTYEIAADQGHYVDEFTVLHEMAVHAGKVMLTVFVVLFATFLPLQWTFVIAAFAAMLLNIIREGKYVERVSRTY